jgi:hypothetical protein
MGWPPTDLNARTGELTPPGSRVLASAKICRQGVSHQCRDCPPSAPLGQHRGPRHGASASGTDLCPSWRGGGPGRAAAARRRTHLLGALGHQDLLRGSHRRDGQHAGRLLAGLEGLAEGLALEGGLVQRGLHRAGVLCEAAGRLQVDSCAVAGAPSLLCRAASWVPPRGGRRTDARSVVQICVSRQRRKINQWPLAECTEGHWAGKAPAWGRRAAAFGAGGHAAPHSRVHGPPPALPSSAAPSPIPTLVRHNSIPRRPINRPPAPAQSMRCVWLSKMMVQLLKLGGPWGALPRAGCGCGWGCGAGNQLAPPTTVLCLRPCLCPGLWPQCQAWRPPS